MAHSMDEENFQRILECPICLERITNPRCLPCLHSFCEKCIGQHMDEKQTNGSFPCPMCTLEFKIPPDGATGFERNLYLIRMSELYPEVSEVKCDVCKLQDKDNLAKCMCIHCGDNLCQICADGHFLSKFTVGHKVVSLEEIRSGQHLEEIRQFQQIYCPKHSNETLKIYCENCVKPLCLLCAMLDHDSHRKEAIGEAANKASDVMQGLLKPWTMASDHSDVLSSERKNALDNLGQQEEQLVGEIEQLYSTFKEDILVEIDLKMNKSIDELKTEIAKARKQLEVAYNEAEFSRATISSTLKYCQQILDSAQDVEKLQQFQDIKTRLEKLDIRKMETEVITPVFKLQPATLKIPDLTMKTLTEFCKKHVTSCLSKRYRQPDIKKSVTLGRSFDSKLPSEKNVKVESYGLAVHDDWLITTGYNSNKVKVFDRSSGGFLFEVDQGQHKLYCPMGVTCNKEGDIFVTDQGIHGVIKYTSQGQMKKVTPNMFNGWSSITCQDDRIIVAEVGGRVLIADFDCNIIKVIRNRSLGLKAFKPWNVCADNEGHLVVGDSGQGRVHVIDYKQPAIVKTFSGQLGAYPQGVCVDEWGHVLVADEENNQVVLMSGPADHARVLITSDDVIRPTDLAVTGPGEVAVLERGGDVKVFKYADI